MPSDDLIAIASVDSSTIATIEQHVSTMDSEVNAVGEGQSVDDVLQSQPVDDPVSQSKE